MVADYTGLRNRKFHELLAQQASSTAPTAHWGAAIARALQGGIAGVIEKNENAQEKSSLLDAITRLGGSSPQFSGTATPDLATALSAGPQTQSFRTAGRPVQVIEGNAETQPSPLDPPSGQDRDIAIRTMYGEDPGQSALGVASVMRRRAIDGNFGGNTLSQVAKAPGQFEPWANPQARSRMEALQPNSPTYQRLGQTLDQAYKGDDPTGGATHFYAPQAQASLGRQAPAWDKGPSTTIGPHKFLGGTGAPQAEPQPDVQTQLAQGPIPPQMGQQGPRITAQQQQELTALANSGPAGRAQAQKILDHIRLESFKRPEVDKPTDEIREYALYRQQGGTKSFFDYKADLKKAGSTQVIQTVDQKAESAFDTKAGQLQAERMDKIVQDASAAKTMISDMSALKEIGSRITTGKTAEIAAALGPYAQALGIKVDGLGDLESYNSIVRKLAPQMRVPGSGATSDFEMRNFLEALPSLGKTPEGNAIVGNVFNAIQEQKLAAADIASKVLNKEITRSAGEKMLRDLPDPLTLWKENKKTSAVANPTAPAVQVIDGYKIRQK